MSGSAGGIVFGAGSGATTALVEDPAAFFQTNQWVPIAIGVALALGTHLLKLAGRATMNAVTAGVAAPVVSAAEDGASAALSIAAIVFPVLVIVLLAGLVVVAVVVVRRFRRRRAARRAAGSPSARERDGAAGGS